jgi:hypothetical protein
MFHAKLVKNGFGPCDVFDAHTFDLQASFFNLTIAHNYEAIISKNA